MTLIEQIQTWGAQLGFDQVEITDLSLSHLEPDITTWLAKGYAGQMHFLAKHLSQRLHPEMLLPGACSAIVVRLNYLPESPNFEAVYSDPLKANISRYAQHRDYHRLIRKRLSTLATRLEAHLQKPLRARAFADSAPVLEKPLAEKAGLGWQGKHTNLIHPKAGSWFFIGVLYTNLDLPLSPPFQNTYPRYQRGDQTPCGSCSACLTACPTGAIIAPYQLDARRCISYLTIEHPGAIPEAFRPLIGNRIYGCDDCQRVCPWNRFAQASKELAFQSVRGFSAPDLVDLFAWDEGTFLAKTEGSAIRRIGYERWLRNIAVALGNAPSTPDVISALKAREHDPSHLVQIHLQWALKRHI